MSEQKIREALVFVATSLADYLVGLRAEGLKRFDDKYYNTAIIHELCEHASIAAIAAGLPRADFIKNCEKSYDHIVEIFGKPGEPPGRRDN